MPESGTYGSVRGALSNERPYRDPTTTISRRALTAGVQKAPRHEVAGSWATGWQRVLWGFKRGARVRDRVILENWQPRMPAQLKRFGTIVAKWGK